jgi:hypothetical protein
VSLRKLSLDQKKRMNTQCGICDENKPLIPFCQRCEHVDKYCKECIVKTIREDLNGKGSIRVTCPKPDCKKILETHELLLHVSEDDVLSHKADGLIFLAYLRSEDNFRWCANPRGCGSGAFLQDDPNVCSYFTCNECNDRTCVHHRLPWHSGMTCTEFTEQLRSNQDKSCEAYILANTKMCPSCNRNIEKSSGCDVMACCTFGDDACRRANKRGENCDHGGLCGQRFCWLCLGLIEADGTRNHKPSCRYNF